MDVQEEAICEVDDGIACLGGWLTHDYQDVLNKSTMHTRSI
jgi:hypothetical protein